MVKLWSCNVLKKLSKEIDLNDLCDIALKNGASRAKVIPAKLIVVDERVQLKCRYPPCLYYGKNLMCPPYTPSAKEFREYVAKYKHAILIQRDAPIAEEIKKRIKGEGKKLEDLMKDESFRSLVEKEMAEEWKKLHAIICAVERECMNKGYYLSLGLIGGHCMLCDKCDPNLPCKKPWEARPGMEAVGIDVYKTAKNSGLEFEWSKKESMVANGLILID
jgi:predicted metal-binding protein